MRNNENGRSMVEMLGVLAIIGVLSAGGLAGYSKAMFKHKLNSTMEQITMIVTNVRTAYGQKGNYANIDLDKAKKLGAVPETVTTNPFKGSIALAADKAKLGDAAVGTAFTLKYTGLPKEACISLATADFGSGAGSGFIGVDAGGSTLDESTVYVGDVYNAGSPGNNKEPTDPQYVAPVAAKRGEGNAYSMAAAIAACKDSEQNTIIWKFY